jgi:hypothetical protein
LKVVDQVGTLYNNGTVWYSKDVIANVLSLAQVNQRFPIRYDNSNGNQFVVLKTETEIIFKEGVSRLYYHNTQDGFTEREFHRAKQAHRALALLGPSTMINNFPVSKIDITTANKTFGPDVVT